MRGGILIVGSLLWDNAQRGTWRQKRLCVEDKMLVKVPICYGRRSSSRGNTFTMTFAPDSLPGQGVLISCRASIDNVTAFVADAEALWKAEQPSAPAGSIGASWGCVGVMFCAEAAPWRLAWTDHFCAKASASVPPVEEDGVLCIPWPVRVADGTAADVDVILATATRAEVKRPTAAEIADAWIDQCDGRERYFFENVRHGIRTHDDGLIWRRIEQRVPCWLRDGAHAEAVELLRAEAALGV